MMIGEISLQECIPRKFLEQILLELKRHGILQSKRGKHGGYDLLMAPDCVTFGQVLRIVDGPIAPLPCLSRIAYRRCADCKTEEACEIRRVFAKCWIEPPSPTPLPRAWGTSPTRFPAAFPPSSAWLGT